jgi:hypothetical protein
MEDVEYKIYTGKEFKNQNDCEFYVFSKEEIDTKKPKKTRLINLGVNIYNFDNIKVIEDLSNTYIFPKVYIYKVIVHDDTEVTYEIIDQSIKKIFIKGKFELHYEETLKEYFEKYRNCLNMIKKGYKCIWFVPEKNKTYELIMEAIKKKSISIEVLDNFIKYEFKTYELCMEIVKKNWNSYIILHSIIPYEKIDVKMMKTYIENNYDMVPLSYIPPEFKTYEIMLLGVRLNGLFLCKVPSNLFSNELYLEAIKNNNEFPKIISHLNDELRIEMVKKNGYEILDFESNKINKELLEEAVKKGKAGINIFLKSNVLKEYLDYKLFITSLDNQLEKEINYQNYSALLDCPKKLVNLIPNNLFNKKKVWEKLIKINPNTFFFMPKEYLNHDFFTKVVENYNEILRSKRFFEIIDHPMTYGLKLGFDIGKFLTYDICLNKLYGSSGGGCCLDSIPKDYKTIEVCVKAVIDNDFNINYVPRNLFDKVLKKTCKEDPYIFSFIREKISDKNICEIFLENIYENPEVCNSIIEIFFKSHYDLFYDLLVNNREYFQKKIDNFYEKINKEFEKNMLSDLISIFEIFIKLKNNDAEDNNIYIIDKFLSISFLFDIFFRNDAFMFYSGTPKDTEKALKRIFDKSGKEKYVKFLCKDIINKKHLNAIKSYSKKILIAGFSSELNFSNMQYPKLTKLINLIKGNYYSRWEEYCVIDSKIINFDEEQIYLYSIDYLKRNYDLIDFLFLYLDRFRLMMESNFELSLEKFEIPNKRYLKKARYMPVYLEELIIFENNNKFKISIKELTKKLKTYVAKFDKTFSNKITTKKVVDNLLEKDE